MLATAARGTAEPMEDRIGECGAAAATRRTEPGNMAVPEDRIVSREGRGPLRALERVCERSDGSRCGQRKC